MGTIVDLEGIIEKIQSKATDVEIVWESEAWRELSGTSRSHPHRISVLDSSFNPPTLAHLSLALVPPAAHSKEDISPPNHIAHLLLLSVRNADKKLKPGDASFAQRLQMIILLAKEMEARLSSATSGVSNMMRPSAAAVAAIDEPTFVGKSKKLLEYFRGKYPNNVTVPRLTFVLGYDTIIRFFNPKYYDSHDGMVASLNAFFHQDSSSILCAQRSTEGLGLGLESTVPGSSSSATDEEIAFFQSSDVEPYVRSGAVSMCSIDSTESALSSTLVRQSVALTEAPPTFEDTTTPDLRPRDWRSMVPPTVAAYIVRNSLYVRK